jgi:hypothetical protein
MELLIVLGLCFGAYELLGVFQGCFHNEPPLPYQQPQLHHKRSSNSGIHNDETKDEEEEETDNESDEQLNENRRDSVDSDEYLSERKIDKENKSKSASEVARNNIRRRAEDEVGDLKNKIRRELDEEENGPCSCYSTNTDFDEYDDDTKSILSSKLLRKKSLAGRKNHPISKFSLSSSLMSLNRDDLALFNYIDSISSSSKFAKFKSEVEISETSFNKISSNKLSNERRWKKSLSDFAAVNSTDSSTLTVAGETYNNEINAERNNPTVDSGRKKIFFISAAS